MSTGEPTHAPPVLPPRDELIVREMLKAVLDSPQFSKSKRYPVLLAYIVNNTLACNTTALKERVIGCEVFERTANYDPSIDAIVRTTAGEVRRRLASYFSEHPEAPVRIDLPVGSYVADLHFRPEDPGNHEQQSGEAYAADPSEPIQAVLPASEERRKWPRWLPWSIFTTVLLLVVSGLTVFKYQTHRRYRDFWWQVLNGSGQASILVGGGTQPGQTEVVEIGSNPGQVGSAPGQLMLGSATATAEVCSVFRTYGRECRISSARTAILSDLRRNSVVLIGALDNPWTLKIQAPLRYQFVFDTASRPGINTRMVIDRFDANSPTRAIVGRDQPFGTDFAIISKFHSDVTDGTVVIVGGLTHVGTAAAGEFLTSSPAGFEQIAAMAPKGWKGENFEAVLEIEIIQGSAGHTKIVGTQFW